MVYQFWIIFLVLFLAIIICDRKFRMLRDTSQADKLPYSWARVQLAWWTVIVLSAFVSIIWMKGNAPTLHYSTLVLLGISAATITTARAIDISDQDNPNPVRHQDLGASNFFLDILSDQNGASIHRFQAIIFNAVFGIWFISSVVAQLQSCNTADCINDIMPAISDNNLILLGLSSATYAALKSTENKVPATTAANAPNASNANVALTEEQPVG